VEQGKIVINQVLGNRYKLLEEAGSGGMAWVYLGEDLIDGRKVAVKVLYPQYTEDIAYIQRFVREAKLALGLNDPHIVQVLNYGSDRDVHYLVMEYIEGKDLKEILEIQGQLPYQEALSITNQVARALRRANERGIVHRDIKPQNLMVTNDGTVKVLDFGIARMRALPSLTQSGFVGSPYYISPEQAMGEGVDIRSDIYSLGVVLYEMLTNKLPFDASSPWSVISQHIASAPSTIPLNEAEVPSAVQLLVTKALAKRPEDRFQSPEDLLEAIESATAGEELPTVRPPSSPQAGKVHELLLTSLYDRAHEAADAGQWTQAVNLYTQILKYDSDYRDVGEKLAKVGRQKRLKALYAAAEQAIVNERWQEAVDELSEIIEQVPDYRETARRLELATAALEKQQREERLAALYQQGLRHLMVEEWPEAIACLERVYQEDENYQDVARRLSEAKRGARRATSLIHRLASRWRKKGNDRERKATLENN
jgi:predicted Ser/Thr protein kinase/outer membrane protein assembly factor BamD (BamD/ComL family)